MKFSGNYQPCTLVAECGCNHQGNFDLAVELIKTAKICGADVVKFQKRNPEECVPEFNKHLPHPEPYHAYGDTYLQHRQALELSIEQHASLKNLADSVGIRYACSVWDATSAREIISISPAFIKMPSPLNCNFSVMDVVFNEYEGDVHISVGMSTYEEKRRLYEYLLKYTSRVVVYWTVSEYPVPFERTYLLEILNLLDIFPRVGYSGHHLGICIDIASYLLGCTVIERHFTMDRTFKGTDHAASLEPDGLRRLARDLKATHKSLQYKDVELTEKEIAARKKMRVP